NPTTVVSDSDGDHTFGSENENNLQDSFSDDESHQSSPQLYVGLTLSSWEEVDNFVELYGKNKGFSFRRSRNNLHSDHSSIRHRSYECSYSRVHKAKKIVDNTKQRDRYSAAINCPWHINFNNRKNTTEIVLKTDAAETLKKLIELKADDPGWVVVPNIEEQLNNATNKIIPRTVYTDADPAMGAALRNIWSDTHHSYCIFHLNNNFVKKLKPIMGKQFDECYKLFYRSQNSLFEVDFEHCWAEFVEFLNPFPKASRYALETLYSTRCSWAICYTQTRFTAGIQSTQRVEGMNAIIKKEVSHSSTLLHLIDAIQNRLDEEARYARISKQKNTNPSVGLPHIANRYFPAINSLIQKYLTPHILSFQREQLSESFLYDASEITYEWGNEMPESTNIIENGYLEDDYERRQTCLKNSQISADKDFVASLPPIKLCESNESSTHNSIPQIVNFQYLSHFRVANVLTPSLQKSVSEKERWSKGYGIAKKALNLMIRLNCDDEFLEMMEEFISSKTHELQISDKNKDANNFELQPAIANPFVTKHCGRPPKRYKSALEHTTSTCKNRHGQLTDNNKPQEKNKNKCANCRNYGHNV
ncbi:7231_t:CDS:2, partial [Cetraspora pellucida]